MGTLLMHSLLPKVCHKKTYIWRSNPVDVNGKFGIYTITEGSLWPLSEIPTRVLPLVQGDDKNRSLHLRNLIADESIAGDFKDDKMYSSMHKIHADATPSETLKNLYSVFSSLQFTKPQDSLTSNQSNHQELDGSDVHSRSKRYISYPRNVEVMVAVDHEMKTAHNYNLQHYILTLMAIVSIVLVYYNYGCSFSPYKTQMPRFRETFLRNLNYISILTLYGRVNYENCPKYPHFIHYTFPNQ